MVEMRNNPSSEAKRRLQRQGGQAAFLVVVFLLAAGLALASLMSVEALADARAATAFVRAKQSYVFAEGGIEDALYRLAVGKNMPETVTASADAIRATTTVSTIAGGNAITTVATQPAAQRSVRAARVRTGDTQFAYASQIGDEGLTLFSNARVNGDAYSNGNISGFSGSRINGNAFAVGVISSPAPLVSGTKQERASPVPLPTIDSAHWQAQANINNDPIDGSVAYFGSQTLGPRRINGNLLLSGGAELTVTGPLYIAGDLTLDTNAKLKASSDFGSEGVLVIAEGLITLESNAKLLPTGATPSGYLIVVSMKTGEAIAANALANADGVLYAPNGVLVLSANSSATAVSGAGVQLYGNAQLTYDLGLREMRITDEPPAQWDIGAWGETP